MRDLGTTFRDDESLLNRATVHIVDSCEDSRKSTAFLFASLGCRVVEYPSMLDWQRGSTVSSGTGVDLLLLTAGHRDADALQFVRGLPDQAKQQTPIVIISTVREERFVAAARRCGVFHTLAMPGTEPELRSVAQQALRSSLVARSNLPT